MRMVIPSGWCLADLARRQLIPEWPGPD
jgi:hypothetical protein